MEYTAFRVNARTGWAERSNRPITTRSFRSSTYLNAIEQTISTTRTADSANGDDDVHSLLLERIVRAPVVQVVAQTADEHSQHFEIGERVLHVASLSTRNNIIINVTRTDRPLATRVPSLWRTWLGQRWTRASSCDRARPCSCVSPWWGIGIGSVKTEESRRLEPPTTDRDDSRPPPTGRVQNHSVPTNFLRRPMPAAKARERYRNYLAYTLHWYTSRLPRKSSWTERTVTTT